MSGRILSNYYPQDYVMKMTIKINRVDQLSWILDQNNETYQPVIPLSHCPVKLKSEKYSK